MTTCWFYTFIYLSQEGCLIKTLRICFGFEKFFIFDKWAVNFILVRTFWSYTFIHLSHEGCLIKTEKIVLVYSSFPRSCQIVNFRLMHILQECCQKQIFRIKCNQLFILKWILSFLTFFKIANTIKKLRQQQTSREVLLIKKKFIRPLVGPNIHSFRSGIFVLQLMMINSNSLAISKSWSKWENVVWTGRLRTGPPQFVQVNFNCKVR